MEKDQAQVFLQSFKDLMLSNTDDFEELVATSAQIIYVNQ